MLFAALIERVPAVSKGEVKRLAGWLPQSTNAAAHSHHSLSLPVSTTTTTDSTHASDAHRVHTPADLPLAHKSISLKPAITGRPPPPAAAMQRFTVALVDSTTPGTALTLAVPFNPGALVSAFTEELFRRATKQGLELAPDTHVFTLHLDSETGQ